MKLDRTFGEVLQGWRNPDYFSRIAFGHLRYRDELSNEDIKNSISLNAAKSTKGTGFWNFGSGSSTFGDKIPRFVSCERTEHIHVGYETFVGAF